MQGLGILLLVWAGGTMKKSTAVTLIISGALAAGCNDRNWGYNSGYYGGGYGTNQVITNNTYVQGYGYWHAPYHDWFPYPYNYYRPGYGYFHGGFYSEEPQRSLVTSSSPLASSFGGSSFDGSHSYGSAGEHAGVSRGGFGGSAHGFGGG